MYRTPPPVGIKQEARRLLSEAAWSGKTEEARYLIKKHFKGRVAKMDEVRGGRGVVCLGWID